MTWNLRELVRHLGFGLLAPLLLVTLTGVYVFLHYQADPVEGPRRLAEDDDVFQFVRSLHLWSSRALLAAAIVHVGRVLWDRAATGPHRRTYLLGSGLLAVLALEHLTGHVLRWDEAGRALAAAEVRALAYFGGADRWLFLQSRGDEALLAAHVPLHLLLFPFGLLLFVALHLGTVQGGLWVRPDRDAPRPDRAAALNAGVALLGFVVVAALLAPAPAAQAKIPWPFGPFEALATLSGHLGAFFLAAAFAWGLVVAQPWLIRNDWARRVSWGMLAGLALASPLL